METPETVDSSSSSSPGENDTVIPPMYENIRPGYTERSPSPAPPGPNFGASGSRSGHSSAGKNPRYPRRSNSQRRHVPSFAGRRQKDEGASCTFAEMVEIGKQKLELVRQMYQVEITNKDNIATIEECMARVYSLPGITNERVVVAADALKVQENRQVFMTMNDKYSIMWLDRQIAKESVLFRQFLP